jgi:hypothetical protein
MHTAQPLKNSTSEHLINLLKTQTISLIEEHINTETTKSLERALTPRPAAYEAAALPG